MNTSHTIPLKHLVLSATMFLCAFALSARQLTPEEAFSKATASDAAQSVMNAGAPALDWSAVKLLDTRRVGDINAVYVMRASDADKVMILAADDVARPLLGWFDAGTRFEASEMPPALRCWLDVYAREIAAAVEAESDAYTSHVAASSSALKDVAPLVTTRWNQSAPYNSMCPTLNGQATYTGCVATAMAQIVNYHRWPDRCSGMARYYWANGADSLRLDMSTIAPDWDNMADVYNSSSTDAQRRAVAELMMACGYSAHMGYGTQASGAYDQDMLLGLLNNFGYAKSMELLYRQSYGLNEWVGILHNELINGRPMYYSGRDVGGHAFVVDGFRSPDYFHINWGWGGMSDGYFVITALDPDSQGIGGSASGYNYDQCAVVGIRKDYPGSVTPVSLYMTQDFGTVNESYSRAENVYFLSGKAYIQNIGATDIDGLSFGVRLTDASTEAVTTLFDVYGGFSLPSGYAVSSFYIPASQFPESGRYRVEPIAKVGGNIVDIRNNVGDCRALLLDASATALNFSQITEDASIRAVDLRVLSRVYQGKTLSLEATVEGLSGEYYSTIVPKIYQGRFALAEGTAMLVDVPAGSSRQVKWTVDMSGLLAGEYTIYIADDNGKNIGGPLSVEVLAVPSGTPSLAVEAVNCDAVSGDGTWRTPWVIPANHITLTSVISNSAGLFDGYVTAYIFPAAGGTSLAYLGYPAVTLGPDESYQWIADTDLSVLEPGSTYFIRFYSVADGTQTGIGDYYYITAAEYAAIDNVQSDDVVMSVDAASSTVTISHPAGAVLAVEAYSPVGMQLGAVYCRTAGSAPLSLTLPRGIALLRITLSSGAAIVRKVVIP